MSPRLHPSSLLLLCAACFNPTGQLDTTDASSSGPGTSSTSGTTAIDPTTGSTGGGSTDGGPTGSNGATTDPVSGSTGGSSTGGSVGCVDQPAPDSYCSSLDPEKPYCDLTTQACVACVEDAHCPDALKPACNRETRTCGCTEHSECAETACELDLGTCFPKAMTAVVHSKASDLPACSSMPGPTCDELDPCCSIDAAITKALLQGTKYIVVRVAPSTLKDTKVEFALPTAGKRIAILGDGTPEVATTLGPAPLFFSSVANKVYLAGLRLSSTTAGAAVSCFGADGIWADDLVVHDVDVGVGFYTALCPLTVRRSVVRGSNAGVHVSSEGVARISDTIIAAPKDFAFKAEKGGTIDVAYTTALDRSGVVGRLVQCFDTDMGTAFTARNSALLADPELGSATCSVAVVNNSVVTAMSLIGTTVVQILPSAVGPLFVDYAGNDLHVAPDAKVLKEVGVRQFGDSLTDIDRQPRPIGEGASDWAGADRP